MDWVNVDDLINFKGSKGRKKCNFRGCEKTQIKHPLVYFFAVPKNDFRTHKFLQHMGYEDPENMSNSAISNLRVCHFHFRGDMFDTQARCLTLCKTAIPVHHTVALKYPANIDCRLRCEKFLEDQKLGPLDRSSLQLYELHSQVTAPRAGLMNTGVTCYVNAALQAMFSSQSMKLLFLSHKICEAARMCPICTLKATLLRLVRVASNTNIESEPPILIFEMFNRFAVAGTVEKHNFGIQGDCMEFFMILRNIMEEQVARSGGESFCGFKVLKTFVCLFCQLQRVITTADLAGELRVFLETNLLTSVKKYFRPTNTFEAQCPRCRVATTQREKLLIDCSPQVLLILIERLQFDNATKETSKSSEPIKVPHFLNLKEFIVNKSKGYIYVLRSAVIHTGSKPSSGHYYVVEKTRSGFIKYNDIAVSACDADELEMASALIYEKVPANEYSIVESIDAAEVERRDLENLWTQLTTSHPGDEIITDSHGNSEEAPSEILAITRHDLALVYQQQLNKFSKYRGQRQGKKIDHCRSDVLERPLLLRRGSSDDESSGSTMRSSHSDESDGLATSLHSDHGGSDSDETSTALSDDIAHADHNISLGKHHSHQVVKTPPRARRPAPALELVQRGRTDLARPLPSRPDSSDDEDSSSAANLSQGHSDGLATSLHSDHGGSDQDETSADCPTALSDDIAHADHNISLGKHHSHQVAKTPPRAHRPVPPPEHALHRGDGVTRQLSAGQNSIYEPIPGSLTAPPHHQPLNDHNYCDQLVGTPHHVQPAPHTGKELVPTPGKSYLPRPMSSGQNSSDDDCSGANMSPEGSGGHLIDLDPDGLAASHHADHKGSDSINSSLKALSHRSLLEHNYSFGEEYSRQLMKDPPCAQYPSPPPGQPHHQGDGVARQLPAGRSSSDEDSPDSTIAHPYHPPLADHNYCDQLMKTPTPAQRASPQPGHSHYQADGVAEQLPAGRSLSDEDRPDSTIAHPYHPPLADHNYCDQLMKTPTPAQRASPQPGHSHYQADGVAEQLPAGRSLSDEDRPDSTIAHPYHPPLADHNYCDQLMKTPTPAQRASPQPGHSHYQADGVAEQLPAGRSSSHSSSDEDSSTGTEFLTPGNHLASANSKQLVGTNMRARLPSPPAEYEHVESGEDDLARTLPSENNYSDDDSCSSGANLSQPPAAPSFDHVLAAHNFRPNFSSPSDGIMVSAEHARASGPKKLDQKTKKRCRKSVCPIRKKLGLVDDKDLTPRKAYLLELYKKMKKKAQRSSAQLRTTKKTLKAAKTPQSALKLLEPLLSKESMAIVRTQVDQGKRHAQGHRFELFMKLISLSLWRSGPRTYGILSKLFTFPSVDTLQLLMRNFELLPGFNVRQISLLMLQTKKIDRQDQYVNLIWDETRIKPFLEYDCDEDIILGYKDLGNGQRERLIATEALVFLVTSINNSKAARFKYPVAYYLTDRAVNGSKLKSLISFWLKVLIIVGLKPVLTTCDQNSTNILAIKALGATQRSPFVIVLNRVIVCTFDPPHLLKCIRNLLLKNFLHIGNSVIKMAYYHKLHEENLKLHPRRCPKLTNEHLDPRGKVKMKVSKAGQLMSEHVADFMAQLIDSGTLAQEAQATETFTRMVDQMFDSFNGRPKTKREDGKCLREAITEVSKHFEFWAVLEQYTSMWKFKTKAGASVSTPTPTNICWNLRAYKILWSELRQVGFTELYLGLCNQDPLENSFAIMKLLASLYKTPIASSLIKGYKTSLLNKLTFKSALNEGNCQDDGAQMLFSDIGMLLDPKNADLLNATQQLKSNMNAHGLMDDSDVVQIFPRSTETSFDPDALPTEINLEHSNSDSASESQFSTDSAWSHTDFEEDASAAEEVEITVQQVGMDATRTKEIIQLLFKSLKCNSCNDNIVTDQVLALNFINYRSANKQNFNPNEEFNAKVISSVRFLDRKMCIMSHESDLKVKLCGFLKDKYDLSYGCELHKDIFSTELIKIIALNVVKTFVNDENKRLDMESKGKSRANNVSKNAEEEEQAKRKTRLRRRQLSNYYSDFPILNKRSKV